MVDDEPSLASKQTVYNDNRTNMSGIDLIKIATELIEKPVNIAY